MQKRQAAELRGPTRHSHYLILVTLFCRLPPRPYSTKVWGVERWKKTSWKSPESHCFKLNKKRRGTALSFTSFFKRHSILEKWNNGTLFTIELFCVPKSQLFLVFVGTSSLTENYFCEIMQPIGSCKQMRFLGHGSCLLLISLLYYRTSLRATFCCLSVGYLRAKASNDATWIRCPLSKLQLLQCLPWSTWFFLGNQRVEQENHPSKRGSICHPTIIRRYGHQAGHTSYPLSSQFPFI